MTDSPTVSVVIPTHERCGLLKEAVDSVFAQTFDDWELVIVDDASEDDTWQWLGTLSDPRIKKIRMESRSEQSTTRNTGLRAAIGEYVVSLDDDDMLESDALRIHVEAFRRYPDAIASIAGFSAFDEDGGHKTCRIVSRPASRNIWLDILFGWTATVGQSAIRRATIMSIGGWNEAFPRATDHEMWARLTRLGPAALSPEIALLYRVHGGQWRPPDLDRIMTHAREVAVEQTDGRERLRGQRALRARQFAQEAREHFDQAHAGKATWLYFKSLWSMPSLLRSPLTRPMVLTPMTRCLLGSAGLRLALAHHERKRRRRNEELDFSVRTTGYPDHVRPPATKTRRAATDGPR